MVNRQLPWIEPFIYQEPPELRLAHHPERSEESNLQQVKILHFVQDIAQIIPGEGVTDRKGTAGMGLIITIIIGGIIGWSASVIMKAESQMGILANLLVGILGSGVGHFLAGVIGLAAYGAIARLAVGVCGAVLLMRFGEVSASCSRETSLPVFNGPGSPSRPILIPMGSRFPILVPKLRFGNTIVSEGPAPPPPIRFSPVRPIQP